MHKHSLLVSTSCTKNGEKKLINMFFFILCSVNVYPAGGPTPVPLLTLWVGKGNKYEL